MNEEDATVEVKDLDEAEAEAALEGEEGTAPDDETASAKPDWATIPAGVKMPKPGCSVAFIRIPAKWTTDPGRGERWCCCWALGETEERLAYQRSRGDMQRAISELAKGTVRIVDGHKADWSGVATKQGSVTEFWGSIGPKGRQMIRNYYMKTHSVSDEESFDFFSNHFVNVTVG